MKQINFKFIILTFLIILMTEGCSTKSITFTSENIDRDPASFQSCLVTMNNIVNYKMYFGSGSSTFSKAKTLDALEKLYGDESLIDIQRRLANEEILSNNKNLLEILAKPLSTKNIPGKKKLVSKEDAAAIYKAMDESNVNKNHYCYDPSNTIGFCFGRATIAHMEAIVRDIHPEAIRKIWVAGDMGQWGHHVATMVKTEDGWVVLDTNFGMPYSVEAWIASNLTSKAKDANEIMVFVTQAGRFGPYDTSTYSAVDLFNTNSLDFNKAQDYYRGYFHDYFDDLDNVLSTPHKPTVN